MSNEDIERKQENHEPQKHKLSPRKLTLKDIIIFLIAFATLIGLFMGASLLMTGLIGFFV